jgi:hypothetical protein
MRKKNGLLIASITNAVFFLWVYATHVFEITWTIAGVIHELFIIPMILLAPVILLVSIGFMIREKIVKPYAIPFLISLAVVTVISWNVYLDFA